jgi:hypothetical protein
MQTCYASPIEVEGDLREGREIKEQGLGNTLYFMLTKQWIKNVTEMICMMS